MLLLAAVLGATAAPRRRRLGEALDLRGLRRLAEDGKLGPHLLFKLDGASSYVAETAAECTAKATSVANCTAAAEDKLAETVADAICKSPAEHVFMLLRHEGSMARDRQPKSAVAQLGDSSIAKIPESGIEFHWPALLR